jgi:proprotein convertase subtilisin/kexin type 2
VMDAGDIVDLAKHWVIVPDRFHCTAGSITGRHQFTTEPLTLSINTDSCKDQKNQVNYLEHVQAFITLRSARRGDVQIFLTSPMGTTSLILSTRPNDADSAHGFTKWPFMTTHMWAENPRGNWTLRMELSNDDKQSDPSYVGVMTEWTLVLHGTHAAPYENVNVNLQRHAKLAVVKRKHANKNFIR